METAARVWELSMPQTRWDEIIPHLYQGGHDYESNGDLEDVIVRDEFDLVVSLYERGSGYGPDPGVQHLRYLVPDGPLHVVRLGVLRRLADDVAEAVREGRDVLVRCQAGLNRSGLVVGLALIRLGYSATDAISLIRRRRSRSALFNAHFVGYLHAEQKRMKRERRKARRQRRASSAGGQSPAGRGSVHKGRQVGGRPTWTGGQRRAPTTSSGGAHQGATNGRRRSGASPTTAIARALHQLRHGNRVRLVKRQEVEIEFVDERSSADLLADEIPSGRIREIRRV